MEEKIADREDCAGHRGERRVTSVCLAKLTLSLLSIARRIFSISSSSYLWSTTRRPSRASHPHNTILQPLLPATAATSNEFNIAYPHPYISRPLYLPMEHVNLSRSAQAYYRQDHLALVLLST